MHVGQVKCELGFAFLVGGWQCPGMEAAADSQFKIIKITACSSKEHNPQGLLGYLPLRAMTASLGYHQGPGPGDSPGWNWGRYILSGFPGSSATQPGLGPTGMEMWFGD